MRIIAAFAYRYEPDWLVDELRESLAGWVDACAILDDRQRVEPWGDTAERTAALMRIAAQLDPDYIFYTAPDERLEDGGGIKLRALAESGPDRFRLNLREMWTPTHYRSDGLWGRKRRTRFYRPGTSGKGRNVDIDIYHLKMIEPENRAERVRVHTAHNTWDNKSRGFGYMLDETDLELTPARPFSPAYRPYRFEAL